MKIIKLPTFTNVLVFYIKLFTISQHNVTPLPRRGAGGEGFRIITFTPCPGNQPFSPPSPNLFTPARRPWPATPCANRGTFFAA